MTTVSITADKFPHLHDALETCSHDCGGRAGWAVYLVRERWEAFLPTFEDKITLLSGDELNEFLIGEQTYMQEITDKYDLHRLKEFFDDWFETQHEFPPEGYDA